MRPRYGFEDDVTITVEDTKGEKMVARIFWPSEGDLRSNPWGNRRVRCLEEALVSLYTPSTRPIKERQDPCGNYFFTLNPRQMDAGANILTCLTHLKDGRLRITPGPSQNGHPKLYSHTLTAESVQAIRELFAASDALKASRRGLKRERLLAKRRARQGLAVGAHPRGRQSALAA